MSVAGASIAEVRAAGGYSVVYADPPWNYSDKSCNGGIGFEYPGMDLDALKALRVSDIVAPDAVLFMWVTYPFLPQGLELISAWGFGYKSIAFQWLKLNRGGEGAFYGLGRWTRGNTEPCLLATHGKPKRIAADVHQIVGADDGILAAPLTRHSAKPAEAREKIVRLMGDVPRIELFARERVAGWDAWGNEVGFDVIDLDPSVGKAA